MNFQKKILVIEDDKRLGLTIQNILAIHHFDVCYVNSGAGGIQKAFQYEPDLILCDINMVPVDGYEVYKILEESSMLRRVPFIFITGSSDLEDIRFGMSLGADDYIVKPFNNADLIKTIDKRLEKFKAIREDANKEFERLFNLSKDAIIVFDEAMIYKANPAFLNLCKLSTNELFGLKMEQIFDTDSIFRIKENILKFVADKNEIFNDLVQFSMNEQEIAQMRFAVSEFEKFSNYTLYIGLLTSPEENVSTTRIDQYAIQVQSLLKHENIKISESLGEKITNIFHQKQLNHKNHNNKFFTKRENEVLYLSMEGLPIKLIADRLEISDRTVEKYRTKLMEKAGASNMIEVIVFALRNSLVEI